MDSSFLDVYFVQRQQKVFLVLSGLYNAHEKSLIEGECELNFQKQRAQRGKKDLILIFPYIISTILTQETCRFCLSLWTFDNSIILHFTKDYM